MKAILIIIIESGAILLLTWKVYVQNWQLQGKQESLGRSYDESLKANRALAQRNTELVTLQKAHTVALDELTEAKLRIERLDEEITGLHKELNHRNITIHELRTAGKPKRMR